ncbi:hypothetical protein A0H76_2704 [Hepatospora eriocheir]|uniref:Uncharacterized protein n=1 Tax=Hepatospora eriocheir TaxID=1081669 RepID=A0A1X0QEX8_9MICR|nr:hypothetical protein A0H76_2704 [Hepatospora eriocheir]
MNTNESFDQVMQREGFAVNSTFHCILGDNSIKLVFHVCKFYSSEKLDRNELDDRAKTLKNNQIMISFIIYEACILNIL